MNPSRNLTQYARKNSPNSNEHWKPAYLQQTTKYGDIARRQPTKTTYNQKEYEDPLNGGKVAQMSLDEVIQASTERRQRQYTPESIYLLSIDTVKIL